MSKYLSEQISEFDLEGHFLGFVAEDSYKLKYLRLSTETGDYSIKMPKELRSSLYRTLHPGDRIRVSGYRKFNLKKGTTKLKAFQITPAQTASKDVHTSSHPHSRTNSTIPFAPVAAASEATSETVAQKKAHILVCQKSDCCKRGGRTLVRALQEGLSDRGLADQVSIKPTGCMKQCKAGPNLVMPDKTRYSRVNPAEIPNLLEKHFPTPGKTDVA